MKFSLHLQLLILIFSILSPQHTTASDKSLLPLRDTLKCESCGYTLWGEFVATPYEIFLKQPSSTVGQEFLSTQNKLTSNTLTETSNYQRIKNTYQNFTSMQGGKTPASIFGNYKYYSKQFKIYRF